MFESILGSVLGYVGAQETNQANRDIANQANAFSAQQFASRYQTTVKDMSAAGLNPMLAYSQGGGNAPSGQVGHPQQNALASAVEGYRGSMEREILKQQAINMAQENALSKQKLETEKWNTLTQSETAQKTLAEGKLAALNVNKEEMNIPNWQSNLKNQAELLSQQVQEAVQRIKTGQASASQYNALVQQIQQAIKFKGYDEQRLKNMSEAEKSQVKKDVSPYLNELRLLLQALRGAGSTGNVNNDGN